MASRDIVDLTDDGPADCNEGGVIDLSESPEWKRPKPNPPTSGVVVSEDFTEAGSVEGSAPTRRAAEPTTVISSNNQILAELRRAREGRQRESAASSGGPASSENSKAALPKQPVQISTSHNSSHKPALQDPCAPMAVQQHPFSLLTFNVWFNHDAAVETRMQAMADIISSNRPTFIALQEMTRTIYRLLSSKGFWSGYHATPMPDCDWDGNPQYFTTLLWSKDAVVKKLGQPTELPFENSVMGRSILAIPVSVGGRPLVIATSHLESPIGWKQTFHEERMAQCREGFRVLSQRTEVDVLWAGDMNLTEKDGPLQLPEDWIDAWEALRPEDPGYTYDGRSNAMLGPKNYLKSRLDRIFCRLRGWKLKSIDMVGTQAIPGATWTKHLKNGSIAKLPVLPSDHYGLLCAFEPLHEP